MATYTMFPPFIQAQVFVTTVPPCERWCNSATIAFHTKLVYLFVVIVMLGVMCGYLLGPEADTLIPSDGAIGLYPADVATYALLLLTCCLSN